MKLPHTVTVVNTVQDPATLTAVRYETEVSGVLLEPVEAVRLSRPGAIDADRVRLYIPLDAPASGTYVSPAEYAAAEDKAGLWTLDTEGCAFRRTNDGAIFYRVISVAFRDYGGLPHWEVIGA